MKSFDILWSCRYYVIELGSNLFYAQCTQVRIHQLLFSKIARFWFLPYFTERENTLIFTCLTLLHCYIKFTLSSPPTSVIMSFLPHFFIFLFLYVHTQFLSFPTSFALPTFFNTCASRCLFHATHFYTQYWTSYFRSKCYIPTSCPRHFSSSPHFCYITTSYPYIPSSCFLSTHQNLLHLHWQITSYSTHTSPSRFFTHIPPQHLLFNLKIK